MRGFSPLDVMTLRDVRAGAEAGAGIVVLDLALDEILWANGAGRSLFGLSEPGGALSPTSPQGRQVRAAARLIEARGEARILLRPAAGLASKPVVADLKHVSDAKRDFVLLSAVAMRPAESSDLALAERLLSESGLEDAAVYGEEGLLTLTGDFPPDANVPGEAVAGLLASDDELCTVEEDGYRTTLSRVASRLVLVRRDSIASAATIRTEMREDTETPRRIAGFFSVKRGKLPEARGAMSMSALVQRWHRRQDGIARPQADGDPVSEPEAAGDRDVAASGSPDTGTEEGALHAAAQSELTAPHADHSEPESVRAIGEPGAVVPKSLDAVAPKARDERGTEAETPDAVPPETAVTPGESLEKVANDAGSRRSSAAPILRSRWDLAAPVSSAEDRGAGADALILPAAAEVVSAETPSPHMVSSETPIAVPNDSPAEPEGAPAQPVERESVVILPDIPPEEAPSLDVPISDDAEVPRDEALLPEKDEAGIDRFDVPLFTQDAPTPPAASEDSATGEPSAPAAFGSDRAVRIDDEADGQTDKVAAPTETATKSRFEPRFDIAPVRFVWQIDRDGKFRSLSSEFAEAVGPKAAAVLGLSFREVANVFGFDEGGEIGRLLDRRDTWSGRSVLWPVESSDRKVPVDLAALPIYARDRSFDGFRGFGIVRLDEAVPDAEAIGMVLADDGEGAIEQATRALPPEATEAPVGVADKPLFKTFEADLPGVAFGRRQEPPSGPGEPATDQDGSASPAVVSDGDEEPKVIRLEERRRPRDGALSQAEEAAFRAIGMKLGQQSEASPSETLRLAEPPAATGRGVAPDDATDAGEAMEKPTAVALPRAPYEDETTGEAAPADASGGDTAVAENATDDVAGRPHDAAGVAGDVGDLDWRADAEGDAHEPAQNDGLEAPALIASGPSDEDLALQGAKAVAHPEEEPGERPLDKVAMAHELDAIFASLPLPILVQVRETLVYANREFEDLTGYAGIAALEAAGGLDALFVEREDGFKAGELAIRRSNGQVSEVRVHMQRVTLSNRSSLLMSFSPSPRDSAAAAQPAGEERAHEPPVSDELEDLRQEVEELQAVLDTATDGVVLLDPAGTIRAMNGSAHALFGGGLAEHAGRHLSSLFAHESQKATHDYLDMLRDDGLAGILNDGREVIGRVAQGGFIPLFITIGRLSGERGWCVVIRDIAHWKRIEEDLVNARRQAEAASLHKSRFLANVSHELRTPLNAIIGFADVMASECFGPIGNERYLEYLGDIKRSGHHVLDLVNDLLDISKIEAGKLDLAFEAVPLNEVVSEVVALMQPQANRERVIVRSNLPSSVPPVVADRRTMRQIALNLVANAIRFTPAGGQIIASTTYTADGDVLLRFRDSGIGMTEREIEIALTPFQQVHAPSVVRGEGTGLGLPLTKAMVEANRAAFSINSVPGEGTLVEITFPSQRVLAD